MTSSTADSRTAVTWLYVVLGAAAVVEYFEITMMFTILPTLYDRFGDPASVGWAMTAFGLVGAVSVALGGRIGDVIGYRTVLIAALGSSAVGSFLSATASDLWQLIAGRGIQGFAAVILPVGLALMRSVFKDPQRVKFGTGIIAGIGYSISGLAPLTAGVVLERWDWQAVFVLSGIMSLVVMGMAFTLPRETVGSGKWSDIDFVGAIALIPAVVMILLSLTNLASWGILDPKTLILIAAGLVGLWAWYRYEKRVDKPVIDPALLREKSYRVSLVSFGLFAMTLGNVVALSVVAQNPVGAGGFGMSPSLYGLFMLLMVAIGTSMNVTGGWMASRIGCRNTLALGALAQGLGYLLVVLVLLGVETRSLWVFPLFFVAGLGNGVINTVLPAFVAESVPMDKTAMALSAQQVIKQGAQAGGQQIAASLLVAFPMVTIMTKGTEESFPSLDAVTLVYTFVTIASFLIVPVALRAPRMKSPGSEPSPPADDSRATAVGAG